MKSYILVNSGRGYEKFDGVDNEINLRKVKYTPYYNKDSIQDFDATSFENGGLYRIRQDIKDEFLIGTKFIIYHVDFSLKTGDVYYIQPRLMEYRLINKRHGDYINLVSSERGIVQNCNYWEDIVVNVWSHDQPTEALSDYDRKVTEMIELRKEFMDKRTEKELKGLSKLLSKNLQ